ncbi:hypothetical protein FBU30_002021 [Linnemannia zychae]|nr:hypothetical protein FBU30_002021 [Linnemannia zychae]
MQLFLAAVALVLSVISKALAYDAGAAIIAARNQIGGGGHGPNPGQTGGGFDSSGLVRYALWRGRAGDLNGSIHTQVNDRRLMPISESQRQPGDIQFFSPGNIYHVVLYAGNNGGREIMIEAQQADVPVHEVPLRRDSVWRRVS